MTPKGSQMPDSQRVVVISLPNKCHISIHRCIVRFLGWIIPLLRIAKTFLLPGKSQETVLSMPIYCICVVKQCIR